MWTIIKALGFTLGMLSCPYRPQLCLMTNIHFKRHIHVNANTRNCIMSRTSTVANRIKCEGKVETVKYRLNCLHENRWYRLPHCDCCTKPIFTWVTTTLQVMTGGARMELTERIPDQQCVSSPVSPELPRLVNRGRWSLLLGRLSASQCPASPLLCVQPPGELESGSRSESVLRRTCVTASPRRSSASCPLLCAWAHPTTRVLLLLLLLPPPSTSSPVWEPRLQREVCGPSPASPPPHQYPPVPACTRLQQPVRVQSPAADSKYEWWQMVFVCDAVLPGLGNTTNKSTPPALPHIPPPPPVSSLTLPLSLSPPASPCITLFLCHCFNEHQAKAVNLTNCDKQVLFTRIWKISSAHKFGSIPPALYINASLTPPPPPPPNRPSHNYNEWDHSLNGFWINCFPPSSVCGEQHQSDLLPYSTEAPTLSHLVGFSHATLHHIRTSCKWMCWTSGT